MKRHTTKCYLCFCMFFLMALGIYSCTKIDFKDRSSQPGAINKEVQFFTVPANTSPTVQRVANAMKSQNAGNAAINGIADKQGYPVWDKAVITIAATPEIYSGTTNAATTTNNTTANTGGDTLVLIPLVLENTNYVNAFIAAKVSDSVLLKLYRGDRYDEAPFESTNTTNSMTAEKVALQIMLLDQHLYGRTKFKITDDRLFSTRNPVTDSTSERVLEIGSTNETEQNLIRTEIVSVCFDNYHCTHVDGYCTANSCDMCWQCFDRTCFDFSVETWYDDDWGGGGGQTGDGTGGTGGGETGGGGNGDGDPCNGSSNGTPINGGIPPCGADDGGDLGWEPDEDGDEETADPCTVAQNAAKVLDTLFYNSKADSVLSSIPNLASELNEKGFAIIQKIRVSPYNVNDTVSLGYRPGTVETGTDSGIHYTTALGFYERLAASVHTHPAKGYSAPSAKDVYILIGNRMQNDYRFVGNFMAAANGSVYALAIIDNAKASAFNRTIHQYLSGTKWNEESEIGKAFEKSSKYFEKVYKDNPNKINLVYEMSMAAVLKQYNVGITLYKKDAAGSFKPIIVNTTSDPLKPKRTIYIQECN